MQGLRIQLVQHTLADSSTLFCMCATRDRRKKIA